MKQAALAIKTIERTAQILFWAQIAVVFVLASLYMYFVNKTVWNVVARQQTESSIVSLNSELSDMEFKYITAKSNITMDMAQRLGFQPAEHTIFVDRTSGSNVAIR